MKSKTFSLLFNILCFFTVNITTTIKVQAQTINFTGLWKVNLEKSDFGKLPKTYAAAVFKINQDENFINIERTVVSKDTTMKSEEKLYFDGRFTKSDLPPRKKEASIKWSADMLTLIETAIQTYNSTNGTKKQYRSIETFTLSGDKKILVYVRQVISEATNFTIKAIYIKN